MSNKTLIETVGSGVVNPGEGPSGAGFISVCIPSYNQPEILFAIPVAEIPEHLLAAMMKHGVQLYAQVKFYTNEAGEHDVEEITDLESVRLS